MKEYIIRKADESDRRKQIIRLTDKGRIAAEELNQDQSRFPFFDCLSHEEKDQLEHYLMRITQHLDTTIDELSKDNKKRDRKTKMHRHAHALGKEIPNESLLRNTMQEKMHTEINTDQNIYADDQEFCDHNCRGCQLKMQGDCSLRG